jgi:oligopeptide transport system substrate-binding protein
MKSKKWLSALLVGAMVFTSAFSFAGCKKETPVDPNPAPTPPTTEQPTSKKDENQFLKLVFIEPETLDPNEASDTSSFTIISATQEGLARVKVVNDEDKIEPAGAKSWEVSPDGLVWTFHLREEHKWSDGVPVKAQHYVDSFMRLLNKDNAFAYSYFIYEIKGAQAFNLGEGKPEDVGVKAIDDKTLQITLERPTPYFEKKLAFTAFFPIRLDVIEKGGENWKVDHTAQVYCGPYKIKDWVRNNSISFEKNTDYWDAENVYIKTIEMNDIPEFATQAQLFESKELDVTGARQEYIEKWTAEAKTGKFVAGVGDVATSNYVGFNNEGGPSGIMSNKKVRLAMSMAFDRQEYLNTLLGRYTPAYGWVPKSMHSGNDIYRDVTKEPLKDMAAEYVNKPEKIQALFKEGLKELGKDTNDLKSIKIKFVTYGDTAASKQAQEWWEQQFEKNLGIDFEVEVLGNYTLWKQAVDDMKFDVMTYGWVGDFDDPINFLDMFLSDSGNNGVKFSNAEFDKIVKELDKEVDQAKRLKAYQRLEEILVKEEAGIAPLYYGDTRRFLQNYVKDFMYPKFGPIYEWRWAYTEGR